MWIKIIRNNVFVHMGLKPQMAQEIQLLFIGQRPFQTRQFRFERFHFYFQTQQF